MRKLNQAGDTIVEVLIAAAVVGLVLTVAFATSSASLKQIRMSQERSEAHRIAASQVELLKQFVGPTTPIISGGCLKANASGISAVSSGCEEGTDSRYKITITDRGSRTYSVKVVWENLAGRNDQVVIDYRTEN